MKNYYGILLFFNEDNYECCVDVNTKDDLVNELICYFDDQDIFELEEIINVTEDDFEHEIDFDNEVEREKIEYIESLIDWKGSGEYCLTGRSYGALAVMKTRDCLKAELEYAYDAYDFPIPLDIDLFENTEEYIKNWKKEEGYNYIYLVTFNCHTGTFYYKVNYVVYSNKEVDDVIKTVYEQKDIKIGEFGILGANYFVEEVENFNVNSLIQYKFGEYDNIIL